MSIETTVQSAYYRTSQPSSLSSILNTISTPDLTSQVKIVLPLEMIRKKSENSPRIRHLAFFFYWVVINTSKHFILQDLVSSIPKIPEDVQPIANLRKFSIVCLVREEKKKSARWHKKLWENGCFYWFIIIGHQLIKQDGSLGYNWLTQNRRFPELSL